MRILLITPYYQDSYSSNLSMGSAVKQAENLSADHQIVVLTSGRTKKLEKLSDHLTIISVPGLLLSDPINYCITPQIFPKFISLSQAFRPDVVMVSKYMFFPSLIIPLARLLGHKVVTTTDTFPGINWFPRSKPVAAVMWLYARLIGLPLLRLSNKVILLYPGLASTARKYKLNFVTISNGVDDSYFKKQPMAHGIHKPVGEFWVGFVGRLESVKGYDLALAAAKHFEKTDKKIKFVFVGGNILPSQKDNRLYLGFRQDIKRIYQLFDCLILPSYAEGLPNVLLEAMAQGIPCIAANVGGVPSIIEDTQNGFLIGKNNINQLTAHIDKIRRNTRLKKQLSAKARQTITQKYSWSSILDSYNNLLKSLE